MSIDLTQFRDGAVNAVVRALYARHPALAQRFGERGKKACREDINHHLDYLCGALAAAEDALFSNYGVWLKSVLDSRGVPSGHLVESFALLAEYLRAHLAPADAVRVDAIFETAHAALMRSDFPPPFIHERLPALADAPLFREVAVSGNQREAQRLISALIDSGITLSEASVRLVQPAMYEIGRLWQENRITVAQEHLATAISQSALARAYLQATFAPPIDRKAMFAGVAGNHHSLGLRMLSDAFETIGWDVVYLGADVPTRDLVRQVAESSPDLLILSVSLPGHLSVARETLECLRADLGSQCPQIWVGGLATLIGGSVWRTLKADGWAADALHAIDEVSGR